MNEIKIVIICFTLFVITLIMSLSYYSKLEQELALKCVERGSSWVSMGSNCLK